MCSEFSKRSATLLTHVRPHIVTEVSCLIYSLI